MDTGIQNISEVFGNGLIGFDDMICILYSMTE